VPSKGGISNASKKNINNFKYFNGMKIKSSVPSTPLVESPKNNPVPTKRGSTKTITLKKASPRASIQSNINKQEVEEQLNEG
jgi:hypothetical protein